MSVNPSEIARVADLRFNGDGLIGAIVQQAGASESGPPTGRVLMFAWMNREAIERTLSTGKMHYWSRSRQKLWLKGETSGHTQELVSWYCDCDGDALLFAVRQTGGACHTGYESCFFQPLNRAAAPLPVLESKRFDPAVAYAATRP
jgi:phosphoribosyl-AMP cyclohydrolase